MVVGEDVVCETRELDVICETRELDEVSCESHESRGSGAREFRVLCGTAASSGRGRLPASISFDLRCSSSSLAKGGGAFIGLPVSELGASRSIKGFVTVKGEECDEWEVPGRRGRIKDDKGASSSESLPEPADSDVSLAAVRVRGRGVVFANRAFAASAMLARASFAVGVSAPTLRLARGLVPGP